MAEYALNVEIRERSGKGVARKLRAAGRIPGVCYGKGDETVSISLDPAALRRLLERSEGGRNTIISISGGGLDGKKVLVRDLQRDPIRGEYLHADLYTLDLQQKVEVEVPIHLKGKAAGVDLGGVLDHALRELDLLCLPLSIPNEIVVDVSALEIGDSLHVRDLVLPEGVELRSDPDLSVVSVVAAMKEEEVAPAEGEELEGEAVEGAEAAAEGEAPEASGEAEEKSGD